MITLAIETSCDETAICLLETRESEKIEKNITGENRKGESVFEYRILANLIHSQIDLHQKYGGVFPMMAKREHAKIIVPLVEAALSEANIELSDGELSEKTHNRIAEITALLSEKESDLLKNLLASPLVSKKPTSINKIAVTEGPGLEPALWVGINAARALGILWNIPVVGVNHMEGHIVGSLLPTSDVGRDFHKIISAQKPSIALLISGGHTELVLMKGDGYEIIGRTRDDAVGEAFDKAARMLGLPYPGGPEISKLAENFRQKNLTPHIRLPRPMLHSPDLDFSFSGLKTALLYLLKELSEKGEKINAENTEMREAIACEFENAVTEVLVTKTEKAIETYGAASLILGGGVTANRHIAATLKNMAKRHSIPIYMPPPGVSGDNALMIALVGAMAAHGHDSEKPAIRAVGNLSL